MGHAKDEPFVVELGPSRPAKDLLSAGSIHEFVLAHGPFNKAGQDNASGGEVNSRGEGFGANNHRKQFALEKIFDNLSIAREDPGVMHTHPTA